MPAIVTRSAITTRPDITTRPAIRPIVRSAARRLALGALALLLAACAEASTGPDPVANEVRVGDNFFNPGTRNISTGTTITWNWNSGSSTHNVTFDDGPASANQSSGNFERTFNNAGSFPYHCTIHGSGMSGTIVVN
jgi:plastocyanin